LRTTVASVSFTGKYSTTPFAKEHCAEHLLRTLGPRNALAYIIENDQALQKLVDSILALRGDRAIINEVFEDDRMWGKLCETIYEQDPDVIRKKIWNDDQNRGEMLAHVYEVDQDEVLETIW
jgi:hypothetical protein